MITNIAAHNWQSLRSVDLPLGRFTVIVGPSNSGKSALVRALRAVTSNVRGGGHITRGAKTASISVTTATGFKVTLQRTAASGSYRLVDPGQQEHTFTSLGGAVPEAVTAALGMAPAATGGVSLHFAGQLDPPYLLAETGATVARELGELTNVTPIFAAVREGARRKAVLGTQLKTRDADLAATSTAMVSFRALPAQVQTCTAAEQTLERATGLAQRTDRLRASIQNLVAADQVLARVAVLPVAPDLTGVQSAKARLDRFHAVITDLAGANNRVAATATALDAALAAEYSATQAITEALAQAGTCPTCGQSVTR